MWGVEIFLNSMLNNRSIIIRPANKSDVKSINHLVLFGAHVHQHLDWRQACDWIGRMPFLVAEWSYQLVAVLACSPDPIHIAWIRLFAVNSLVNLNGAWLGLWEEVRDYLDKNEASVAAIAYQKWFQEILESSAFEHTENVILLQWDRGSLPDSPKQKGISIRGMEQGDLSDVEKIDRSAFMPPWQHSQELLEVAYKKASIATVAETTEGIVGYQISTANASSGHLARLAVFPEWQGRGIGYLLIHHLLSLFSLWGTLRVTVNTQADNISSLALYRKAGFQKTNEIYPVYQFGHQV